MRRKADTLPGDDLERRLLALLGQNARMPVASLARALGVSRASVYARMRSLESRGVIEAYTIRVNPRHERGLIRAHVMLKLSAKLVRGTERHLNAMPEVIALYAISGVYDLIAVLEAHGTAELNDLIDRIGALQGVQKTTSSIILATRLARGRQSLR
jgi:DNA-binding Lrp family transcriptional regulator